MSRAAIPAERIEQSILVLRGHKVLLDADELEALRSQSVISNTPGRRGRRYAPYVFTERGVAMLSSVLNSSTIGKWQKNKGLNDYVLDHPQACAQT